MSTWLITGCSTGLGRDLAEAVLAAGNNVVVTARKSEDVEDFIHRYPDNATIAALDVTDAGQIIKVIESASKRFGTIDVLVNNAGYGYRAAVEEGDVTEVEALFAANFFGTVAMIKAILPIMRSKGRGTILNISSVAGRLASPGSGYYSASKFAIEGMSDALRKEVGPLGIRVCVIEPGPFRTDFAGRSLRQAETNIGAYSATSGPRRKENDKTDGTQAGDPKRAALALLKLVAEETLPARLLLGRRAFDVVTAELKAQINEVAEWENVTVNCDFPQ